MDICQEVKKKKELQGLSDTYITSEIKRIAKKNNFSSNLSQRDSKELVKLVRAELRLKVARFRELSVEDSIGINDKDKVANLIRKHSSTRERLEFYPVLIEKIKEFNPVVILDLGCGINPLALGKICERYEAYDIDEISLKIVSEYFRLNKIQGSVHEEDVNQVESFPHSDLVLMFKFLDVLEKKGHKKAESLINKLDSKNLIISFSTKTLSGAPMNHPQRGWIERLLNRIGYKFNTLKAKNEIFYFASR